MIWSRKRSLYAGNSFALAYGQSAGNQKIFKYPSGILRDYTRSLTIVFNKIQSNPVCKCNNNIYIYLKPTPFLYNKKIRCVLLTILKINYSSSSVPSTSLNSCLPIPIPIPIKVFHILNYNNIVLSYSELLKKSMYLLFCKYC